MVGTYQLEVVSRIVTNVLHDVPVDHPFGDHGKPSILEGVRNPDEIKDVGV